MYYDGFRIRTKLVLAAQVATAVSFIHGQTYPQLKPPLRAGDSTISGKIQLPRTPPGAGTVYAEYLYVCSTTQGGPTYDCEGSDQGGQSAAVDGKLLTPVNLGTSGYRVTARDGSFTIALVLPLRPGEIVWLVQKCFIVSSDGTAKLTDTLLSNTATVTFPIVRSISIGPIAGTDSASREVGVKANVNAGVGNAAQGINLALGATYDDKWKHSDDSSNVTQLYTGSIAYVKSLGKTTVSPFGEAYHNNLLGIKAEQVYGLGLLNAWLTPTTSVQATLALEGIFDNVYSPGNSVANGGIQLKADIDRRLGSTVDCELILKGVPTFPQSGAWSATGYFDLNFHPKGQWSLDFNLTNNYYEVAPKTFNKNYLAPSIQLTYKPK